jgi:uncharacterized ion transporter superfamily protein YfcC
MGSEMLVICCASIIVFALKFWRKLVKNPENSILAEENPYNFAQTIAQMRDDNRC